LVLLVPGLILQGKTSTGLIVKGACATGDEVAVYGYVNRITA
jgi:3-deoxy-D-arabino-heptulosonate 7-phosphate (DAHP) synthase